MQRHPFRRYLKALWRDTQVLMRQFRVSLLAFSLLLSGGSLTLRLFYVNPETGQRLDWIEALHASFKLIFLETVLPLPRAPGVQLLFFIIPFVGLAVVADSVLRFGVALFNRRERKEAWQVAVASTYQNHIIVCGLGRIGYRVVKELTRLGEEVIGIENDADDPFLEEIMDMGVPVLMGDARREEMLEDAGVRNASAIVACTEDDLTNMAIALEAREFNPDVKVVMRMFDAQLAQKVERGFGIHTAFSTTEISAPIFAAAATHAPIDHSFYVDESEEMVVAMTTVRLGSMLDGCTVAQVEQRYDLSIILHKRQNYLRQRPDAELTLRANDRMVVLASLDALAELGKRMRVKLCDVPEELTERPRRRSWLSRLWPWGDTDSR